MRSDEELMIAYARGDAAAFAELFQRYASALQAFMLRQLRVRAEAQDLVQRTFLQLHRARLDFDSAQRFRPWLYTIALNVKREYFRQRKRRPEAPLDMETALAPQTAGEHGRVDARRSLGWALERLPEEQRQVIELHWFAGLAFSEVAECVGVTTVAAKLRAHRGYGRLRELLGDDFDPPRNPTSESGIE